jgi:hypothetical protein
MLDESKTEILINFLKFLLNFILIKHLNYLRRIQNRNPNYFFKISIKFYTFKTFKLSLKNLKQKS